MRHRGDVAPPGVVRFAADMERSGGNRRMTYGRRVRTMADSKRYSWAEITGSGYTGDVYDVYCEFSNGDETWGHDGEYADEPEAYYTDEAAAREHYAQFGRSALADMIRDAPAGTSVSAHLDCYYFEDGAPAGSADEVESFTVEQDGQEG